MQADHSKVLVAQQSRFVKTFQPLAVDSGRSFSVEGSACSVLGSQELAMSVRISKVRTLI